MSVEMFKQGMELFADQWQAPGTIDFYASGDLDDYIAFSVTSNRPLITGVGNYLVLGVDGTAGSATSANDVLVGGKLEVDGMLYADGGVTLGTSFNVLDNILFTLGTTNDGVLVLNTAGLAADAELTGVIEGTSDTLGTAANSLLISNITNDGDIAILVSKAGNTHTAFWADGSTGDTALMAATGASVDVYIAGTKEIDYATGAFAFQQATTISTTTGVLTIDGDDGVVLQTTGSGSVQVKEILVLGIGEGIVGAKTGNVFRAPDHPGGTDTDLAGADITIAAGLGTGDGDAGTIIFQLPEVVGAGTTIQTRATVLTMDMAASTTEMLFTFTPNTTLASSGTLTFGAITLSGAVAGGNQAFTGVGDMTFTAGSIIAAIDGAGTTLLFKSGGLSGTTFITLTSQSGGTDTMILGKTFFYDAGAEYIESNGSTLTIAGAVSFSGSTIVTADSATIEIGAAGVIKSGGTNTDTMLLAANDTTFITFTTADTDVCELDACTLDNSIAKGTWTASGTWTLPAQTWGGAVSGGNQNLNNLGHLGLGNNASQTGEFIRALETITLAGGTQANGTYLSIKYQTTNAAQTATCCGMIIDPGIAAGNTQAWTGNPSIVGVRTIPAFVEPSAGSYVVDEARGFWTYASISASVTLTDWYGLYIQNCDGAGTLTNQYGIYVADMTKGGTLDVGIAIAGADHIALWMCSGSDGTDAANGITFGSSKDTNLYRSAANTLKTDDAFSALSYAVGANAGTDDSGSGTITTFTITIEKGIVTAFAKVS